MTILVFQHVRNEPLGLFETLFTEKSIPVEHVYLYDTNEVPLRSKATHLVFLGGPMSVNDEHEFPWLAQEKELIRRSVKAKKKVLGLCLGAQLIASAYDAKVYKYITETGWRHLQGTPGSCFPERFPAFQLHGETFEIPYNGRLLATGAEVHNQAFSYKTALGLQFHLELNEEIIKDWCKCLRRSDQETILRETPRYLSESNRLCRKVADRFLSDATFYP